MASSDDKATVVADGGAPDGHFLHCLGDGDGHLMPLSPAVRVRYGALYKHCSNYHSFYIFTPICVATCR